MEEDYAIQKYSIRDSLSSSPLPVKELPTYSTTPYRWLVLTFTTSSLVASIFIQMGFSVIASQLSTIYNVSNILVVMCDSVFYLGLAIMSVPVVKIVDSQGVAFGLRLAAIVTVCGAWLRQLVMINDNFVLVFIFQIPPAFVQVFFMNLTSKVANLWFPDRQRVLATSIIALAQPLGALIGLSLPTFYINSNTNDDPISEQQTNFNQYLLLQNVIVTIFTLPLVFIIRERPKYPPSHTAFAAPVQLQIVELSKQLFKNKNYILFVIVFTCFQTLYATFGATISYLTSPYDYTTQEVSAVSLIFIVSGVAVGIALGIALDKTHKYKLIITALCAGALLSCIFGFFALPSGNTPLFGIECLICGATVIPMIPISFSFCVQLTYPVPEALSNGLMLMIGQLIAFFISLLATVQAEANPLYAMGTFLVLLAVALVTALMVKQELKLEDAEEEVEAQFPQGSEE